MSAPEGPPYEVLRPPGLPQAFVRIGARTRRVRAHWVAPGSQVRADELGVRAACTVVGDSARCTTVEIWAAVLSAFEAGEDAVMFPLTATPWIIIALEGEA